MIRPALFTSAFFFPWFFAAAQPAAVDTPGLGFAWDARSSTVRAIRGIPGASVLGDAFDPGAPLPAAAISPRHNIALAISKDPSIVPLVKEVVLMGGSISGGNVNASAEANIYGDPEAAQAVFNASWPLTMVGLDVGERTLVMRKHIAELAKTRGPENDFVVGVLNFLERLSEKFGTEGVPMYDPLAVGVAIDRSLVTTEEMRVDVETRGEFTRAETVANRHNAIERNVPHEDHLWIETVDRIQPNARVCIAVSAEKFIQMFIGRLAGK